MQLLKRLLLLLTATGYPQIAFGADAELVDVNFYGKSLMLL